MAKVSIIIPIYNEEKYLEQCLDSICGQTWKETEIICIDDGSTDNSPRILESYAKKDSRIKIITQKNKFAGVARNRGMECASGKYLAFLDADDCYEPNMMEKMVWKAEANQSDIVICRYLERNGEGSLKTYFLRKKGKRKHLRAKSLTVQEFSRLQKDGRGINFSVRNL